MMLQRPHKKNVFLMITSFSTRASRLIPIYHYNNHTYSLADVLSTGNK